MCALVGFLQREAVLGDTRLRSIQLGVSTSKLLVRS